MKKQEKQNDFISELILKKIKEISEIEIGNMSKEEKHRILVNIFKI